MTLDGVRHASQLFAQGVHPADAAVPRRVPLLHVCASSAALPKPISSSTTCWTSRARARRPAARRRCSRSATSRSCATAPRARRSPRSGTRRRLDYLAARRARGARRRPACCRTSIPACCPRTSSRGCGRTSVSMGLMLESASDRLVRTRRTALRLAGQAAGACGSTRCARRAKLRIPFTTGLLIGIGETRRERIEALLALRAVHARTAHLQELIVQNFRAKPGTRDGARAGAVAGGAAMDDRGRAPAVRPHDVDPGAAQPATRGTRGAGRRSGINDWGGVSPVTPDHVNPEAPWPHLADLARRTQAAGRELVERLAIAPAFALRAVDWVDAALAPAGAATRSTRSGYAREDGWHAGAGSMDRGAGRAAPRARPAHRSDRRARYAATSRSTASGSAKPQIVRAVRGARRRACTAVVSAADALRRSVVGDRVSYVVNRNINYTNICTYHCGFCAFSKGRSARSLRGPGYLIDLAEIAHAHARGLGARCDRGLPAGRHPSRSSRARPISSIVAP